LDRLRVSSGPLGPLSDSLSVRLIERMEIRVFQ
jgi:hypothetical protein